MKDMSKLTDSPTWDARVLNILVQGTEIELTGKTEGVFSEITHEGSAGWIQTSAFRKGGRSTKQRTSDAQDGEWGGSDFFSIFGGIALSTPAELNSQTGVPLQYLVNYGLRLALMPQGKPLGITLGVERLFRSVNPASAETGDVVYRFDFDSTLFELGLRVNLFRIGILRCSIDGIFGYATPVRFTATATSLAQPNETRILSSALFVQPDLDLDLEISSSISFFFSGSYRFMTTSPSIPVDQGNGAEILEQEGQPLALPIDLSGPVLSLGLKIWL